ncbi:MAG: glycosyltransferase family 39 protein [Phycisphaerae bacterium]|nr:glycosyltransferase family 39 protein [Phycisphaerae bacterium]
MNKTARLPWFLALAAVLACVGLRGWMWRDHAPQALLMDEWCYLQTAQWFFDTGEIDTIARGPAYPVFLAAMFRLLPLDLLRATYASQIFLAAICTLLLFVLGRRYFGVAAGLIAAGLFALDPTMAAYSLFVFNEQLFLALMLIGTLVYLSALERGSLVWIAIAGIVFGVATLTRGQTVLTAPFLLAWIILALRRRASNDAEPPATQRSRLRAALAFTLCWAAVVLPWSARNQAKFGTFLLVDATAARTLWHANRIPFRVSFSWPFGRYMENPINGPMPSEADDAARDHGALLRQELRFAADHPGLILRRIPEKWGALWNPTSFLQLHLYQHGFTGWEKGSHAAQRVSLITTIAYALTMLPAAAGLCFGRPSNRLWTFILIQLLVTMAVHALMVSQSRYRVPLMPYVMLLAGYAWTAPFRALAERRRAAGGGEETSGGGSRDASGSGAVGARAGRGTAAVHADDRGAPAAHPLRARLPLGARIGLTLLLIAALLAGWRPYWPYVTFDSKEMARQNYPRNVWPPEKAALLK